MRGIAAIVALLSGAGIAFAAGADAPQFLAGVQVGTLAYVQITEASGMVASRKNQNVLWVHNDSGDGPYVYALNREGDHLGRYYISGASATDWEDIAIGPGPVAGESYLYLGDIGDNSAVRSFIKIYRIAEPAVSSTQSPIDTTLYGASTIELIYPDGPRDAETVLVDPVNKDIYIVSKRDSQSRVYRAAYPQSTSQTVTLEYKTQLALNYFTGGEISPTGTEIIMRQYQNAFLWQRPLGTELWDAFDTSGYTVPLVFEPQGEAICFDAGGNNYYTVSENSYQPIYYFERVFSNLTLQIDAIIGGYYHLSWSQAGNFFLEFDTSPNFSPALDSVEISDTATETWRLIENQIKGFFRLVTR